MSYVEQREAEIKAKYKADMWWLAMAKLWGKMATAISLKRDADWYQGEFNKIRAEYVTRGRKVGSKNLPKVA